MCGKPTFEEQEQKIKNLKKLLKKQEEAEIKLLKDLSELKQTEKQFL